MKTRAPTSNDQRSMHAFTLLEVVLAMLIAVGLMVVALHFYQQVARVRSESVQAIHKLSTVRLLMDKISSDLRSAHSMGYFDSGFMGGADYIQFVKAEVPALGAWSEDMSLATVPPESDLKRVGYTLVVSLDETNQSGSLMRWEEPNWPSAVVTAVEETEEEADQFGETSTERSAEADVEVGAEAEPASTNSLEAGTSVFTDHVQYLRFRYFDGSAWLETWDGLGLPMGVEIQLSTETWVAEEAGEDEFPENYFRRVVCVPSHRADYEAPEDLTWLEDTSAAGTNELAEPLPEEEEALLP